MLWALAVAMPLLEILADSPDFFVARGNTRWDVIVLVLGLVLVPPTALAAIEAALWRAPRARRYLHLVFIAGMGAALVLQLLSSQTARASTLIVPLAVAGGVALAALYAHARFVREMLTVLAPGVLVLMVWFLLLSPVSKLVLPQDTDAARASTVQRPAPVVFLLLDEFPVDLLMTPERQIDAERYPTFARLAREATWYRNATTVADQTTRAVPAMLSGRRPRTGELPIASDHPDTLFSLLSDSHQMQVTESATSLCAEALCGTRQRDPLPSRIRSLASDLSVVSLRRTLPEDIDERLPQVNQTFSRFRDQGTDQPADADAAARKEEIPESAFQNRRAIVDRFAGQIKAGGGKPALHFLHAALPHIPAEYLPGARQYSLAGPVAPGLRNEIWDRDPWLAAQGMQRSALQIAAVDAMLARLLARLRASGTYDRSLVVVTSDHGASYRAGQSRRTVGDATVEDLAGVPLFIKAPGQRRGVTDDSVARTIDIVPTIAKLLGGRPGWGVQGRALPHGGSSQVAVAARSGEITRISFREFQRRRRASLRRQQRLIGTGLGGLYSVGPASDLVGDRAAPLIRGAAGRVRLDAPDALRSVDPKRGVLPVFVSGIVERPTGAGRTLAVTVNGRVRGTTRTYLDAGATRFAALVAPASLRRGRNEVGVQLVAGRPGARTLTTLELPSVRIVRNGSGGTIEGDGRAIKIDDRTATGLIDAKTRKGPDLEVLGWASDPAHKRPIKRILVFADNRLIVAGTTGVQRPDVAKNLKRPALARSGFRLTAPRAGIAPDARIRVFAVNGDSASELRSPASAP